MRRGLRVSEVVSLRLSQIDFNRQMIGVLGKGSKEREVPFHDYAKNGYCNISMMIVSVL